MKHFFQSKGIWISLSILAVTTLLFLTVYKPGHMGKSGIASQSDSPAIQTGKAFEVINPDDSDLSGKTVEELMQEADQLVLSTNQLIKEKGLNQVSMTTEEKNNIDSKLKQLEEQIAELEKQLQ